MMLFCTLASFIFLIFLTACASGSAIITNAADEATITRTVTIDKNAEVPVTITDTINGQVVTRTVTNGDGLSTDVSIAITNIVKAQDVVRTITNSADVRTTTVTIPSLPAIETAGTVPITHTIDVTAVASLILNNDGPSTKNMTDMETLSQFYDIAIPYPARPWTLSDTEYLLSVKGQWDLLNLLTLPEDQLNFKTLTIQERNYKAIFQYLDELQSNGMDIQQPPFKDTWDLFQQLETVLYPWMHPKYKSLFDVRNKSKGAGMVFCVGNDQFFHAATTIRSIRESHKSNIPIEVFYINSNDLSEVKREYFKTEFTNVETVDLSQHIDDTWTKVEGWAMKPFAALASSFSQVILSDADSFFFKNPETLLKDAGFKKTGSLFFYDRTFIAGWDGGRKWMLSFLPTMSPLVHKTRFFTLSSKHEQESGVVVIDKQKSLLGLMSACRMNDKRERTEVTYSRVHGDKEVNTKLTIQLANDVVYWPPFANYKIIKTFWIGYEVMQTAYAFVKSHAAVVGGLGDGGAPTQVCGNMVHLDIDGRPWWWNGGLLRNKRLWQDRYLKFTHFASGDDWDFENSCIKEEGGIKELSKEEKDLTDSFLAIDAQRKKDQQAMHEGTWKPRSNPG
jgi:Mannosyltransferase putative